MPWLRQAHCEIRQIMANPCWLKTLPLPSEHIKRTWSSVYFHHSISPFHVAEIAVRRYSDMAPRNDLKLPARQQKQSFNELILMTETDLSSHTPMMQQYLRLKEEAGAHLL